MVDDWLDGSDHQPFRRRALIADLIDADHVLDPDPRDPDTWFIDRSWTDPAVAARSPWLDDTHRAPRANG